MKENRFVIGPHDGRPKVDVTLTTEEAKAMGIQMLASVERTTGQKLLKSERGKVSGLTLAWFTKYF